MPSPRRLWLYRLLAVAFGLAVVLGLEGVARLLDLGRLPPPTQPEGWTGGFRAVTSMGLLSFLEAQPPGPDGVVWVKTSRQGVQTRMLQDETFTARPAPGVARIFAFGGSATMGVPNEDQPALAFPKRLGVHLAAAGIRAEVINLGGASLGTWQVLEAAREAAPYGPAAFVVYSGDNEFFQYNLRLHEANAGHMALKTRLDALHLVRATRRWVRQLRGQPVDAAAALGALDPRVLRERQDQVTAALISRALADEGAGVVPTADASGALSRVDQTFRLVMEGYSEAMRQVALLGLQATPRFDVFIAEVPTNVLHPPHLSLHRPDLGPLDRRRFETAFADGAEALDTQDWPAAEAAFTEAITLDPLYAGAHHGRGLARLKAGDAAGAAVDLQNAADLDMDPMRPVRAQRAAVRALAAEGAAIGLDVPPPFTAEADPPYGQGLFADVCHLTPAGNDALARHFAARIAEWWSFLPPAP